MTKNSSRVWGRFLQSVKCGFFFVSVQVPLCPVGTSVHPVAHALYRGTATCYGSPSKPLTSDKILWSTNWVKSSFQNLNAGVSRVGYLRDDLRVLGGISYDPQHDTPPSEDLGRREWNRRKVYSGTDPTTPTWTLLGSDSPRHLNGGRK